MWAVLLGNTELAKVLLATCADPMRASLLGARLCNHMAEVLPIEKQGLEVAAAEHESFAIKLLDLCPNPGKASLLLLTPARHWTRTCWSSPSIRGETFPRPPTLQNLIDLNLHGDVSEHTTSSIGVATDGKSSANPLALEPSRAMLPYRMFKTPQPGDELLLLLHAICPCILKLRRSPSAPREYRVRTIDFYNIPYVKQVLRKTMHMLYVLLFSLVVVGERVAPFVYYGMWDVFGVRPVCTAFWTSSHPR